jgi:hypothetical protein
MVQDQEVRYWGCLVTVALMTLATWLSLLSDKVITLERQVQEQENGEGNKTNAAEEDSKKESL